jgi:hypothetical protein
MHGLWVQTQQATCYYNIKARLTIGQDGCIESLVHTLHQRLHLLYINGLISILRQVDPVSSELLSLPILARRKGNLGSGWTASHSSRRHKMPMHRGKNS